MQRTLVVCVLTLVISAFGEEARLSIQLGHSDAVSSVAVSRDGRIVLTGSYDHTAQLWDASSGASLRYLVGHTDIVTSVAVSATASTLLTGSYDRTARLWDAASGTERRLFKHSDVVTSVAFSPDGQAVLTGSKDHTARLWDAASGVELHRLTHSDVVTSVAFSPDGRTVLTGSYDHKARLWDAATGVEVRRFQYSNVVTDAVTSVAFSPDGRLVLTGGTDANARVQLWDRATGANIRRFVGLSWVATSVAFSPDGRFVLAGALDGAALLWDANSGKDIQSFAAHPPAPFVEHAPTSVAFSPDGRFVLTAGHDDRSVRLLDTKTGAEKRRFSGLSGEITSVAFSPDGRLLLTGSTDYRGRLWDRTTGAQLRQFLHTDKITSVAFSPDGRTVLTGSKDQSARLWDVTSGAEIQHFAGRYGEIDSVAFSPDGRLVLTANGDHRARLWDMASATEISAFEDPMPYLVQSVAFSPDGRSLVTGSTDGNARLWNKQNGTSLLLPAHPEVPSVPFHSHAQTSVAFSPDGNFVLTAGHDQTARLWNAATGAEVRSFPGHKGDISSIAFSPDGRFVLTGSEDRTARLWDAKSGREVRLFSGHQSRVTSVAFSPDGQTVMTGGDDGTARLWSLATGASLATLVSYTEGGWAVVDTASRFDTNNLEGAGALHWILDSEQMRALPIEIFMRDYYEPKLLPRLLANDPSLKKPVRPLGSLNRTQPGVSEPQVTTEAGGEFTTVRVRVRSGRSEVQKDAQGRLLESGIYDLRLFRDGQLVGWAPRDSVKWQSESNVRGTEADGIDLPDWRKAHQVKPGLAEVERVEADGTMVVRFDHVRLPRRAGQKEVVFSAYAFNEDRVKSTTATKSTPLAAGMKPRVGKAYVISLGVNRTRSTPAWDLSYAVNDARELSRVVSRKLRDTKQFAEVVPVCLVSDDAKAVVKKEDRCETELPGTKEELQAALDLLAGRQVREPLRTQLAKIVERAQPEDLVLISVSSHGYTDDRGTFHFVTADVNEPQQVKPALDRSTLNTDQLSAWLREVDAGELVLIVDACESEATVQSEGFKPGPMGSRGLGQLAYDKGMRVLAASKAKESAYERDKIGHGLLSYALVTKGLEEGEADWQPKDNRITMSEWLGYAEQEVPKLFAEGEARGGVQRKGAPAGTRDVYHGQKKTPAPYQQPTLFDFKKTSVETVLTIP